MMKYLIRILILAFWITQPYFCDGQVIFDRSINKLADKYAHKHKNRGLVIGIIRGDDIEVRGFGHVGQVQDFTPDEHTIFEVGSLTGVFTTTLLMLETQKGSFRLDDPINGFLPEDVYLPPYQPFVCRMEDDEGLVASGHDRVRMICEPDPDRYPVSVSFCDLASHTSGLPNAPRGLYSWNPLQWLGKFSKDPYHDFTRAELYNNLYRYVLSLPPGSFFQYSDAGMALLGNILADFNHIRYEDLLRIQILEKLGMKDTGIEVPPYKAERFAAGHDKRGKLTEHWHFEAMAPAAGMRSTAGDLLRFIHANLEIKEDLLSQAFAQVQQPRIDVPRHKTGRETMGAYGWFVSILSDKSNLPVNWINGGTGGFRSFMAFNRDRNIGIVILSNSANSVDEMGFDILEYLLEKKDQKFVIESIFEDGQDFLTDIYHINLRT